MPPSSASGAVPSRTPAGWAVPPAAGTHEGLDRLDLALFADNPAWDAVRGAYDVSWARLREERLARRVEAEVGSAPDRPTPARGGSWRRARVLLGVLILLVLTPALTSAAGPSVVALSARNALVLIPLLFAYPVYRLSLALCARGPAAGPRRRRFDRLGAVGAVSAALALVWGVALGLVGLFGAMPGVIFALGGSVIGVEHASRALRAAREGRRERHREALRRSSGLEVDAQLRTEEFEFLSTFMRHRLHEVVDGCARQVREQEATAARSLAHIDATIVEAARLAQEPERTRADLEARAASARADLTSRIQRARELQERAWAVEAAVRERFLSIRALKERHEREEAAAAARHAALAAIAAASRTAVEVEARLDLHTEQLEAEVRGLLGLFRDRRAALAASAEVGVIDALQVR